MPITTASVVGIPSKTTWSTTATLRVAGGEAWCACGFSGGDQSPHEGRHFIDFLESLAARDAQEMYQQVQSYLQRAEAKSAFSVALAYRSQETVLLMTFGFGMVAFRRSSGEFRWLMDGTQHASVLQGSLQAGDSLLLSTARLRDISFPVEQYMHLPVDDFTGDLFPRVQGTPHSGEVAALFICEKGQKTAPVSPASVPEKKTGKQPAVARATDQQLSQGEMSVHQDRHVTNAQKEQKAQAVVSQAATSHLISPEKIRAGVEAAQVQPVQGQPRRVKMDRFTEVFRSFQWRQLHFVRITAVVGVVVVLVGGLIWYRAWNVQREYARVVQPLEQLVQELQQTENRFDQRAQAETLLERIQATRVSYNANRRQVLELESDVESIFNEVSGQRNVVNLPVFYDFRLISPDFLATKVARSGDTAFFLDANQQEVISLNINNKQNEVVPLESLEEPRDITIIGSRLFVLTPTGVQTTTLSGADARTAVAFDADVENPSYVSSFGENVYVLDRGAQQIWRADALDDEASPSAWVRSAAGVDFASISSFAINGSIWLGANDGEVYQLLAGQRESYSFVGLPEPFTSSLLIAANEEGEKLVVVEPAQKRLVVFQKETGEYLQQITSEQIGAVTDVVLDEEERLVYLLAGSVVYRVEVE